MHLRSIILICTNVDFCLCKVSKVNKNVYWHILSEKSIQSLIICFPEELFAFVHLLHFGKIKTPPLYHSRVVKQEEGVVVPEVDARKENVLEEEEEKGQQVASNLTELLLKIRSGSL